MMLYIVVCYVIVLGLAALVGVFWIGRNLYKQNMKEENGRIQIAEIKRWEAIYLQRPTVYELWIEYVENGEKKERLIRSSGSFLKRYKREKMIRIVTVPGTDLMFAEEENWQEQNVFVSIMIAVDFVFVLHIIALAEIAAIRVACYSVAVLYFLSLFFILWCKKRPRTCIGHKTRMEYLVKLSCDEAIKTLVQGNDDKFQLKKETENIKDKGYIFSMHDKVCKDARYRVFVTPAQEGSAVWFYLLECSNPYALNRCAEKLERFMEKKIAAVRVE